MEDAEASVADESLALLLVLEMGASRLESSDKSIRSVPVWSFFGRTLVVAVSVLLESML